MRLTNHAELLMGIPNEDMAAKAAHAQKLRAEGVDPAEAMRVALASTRHAGDPCCTVAAGALPTLGECCV